MGIRDVLALNLRRLRRERGLSQEALAHQANVDRTYVSAIERSVYATSIDVLERLALVLDVEAAELLVRPETEKRSSETTAPTETLPVAP